MSLLWAIFFFAALFFQLSFFAIFSFSLFICFCRSVNWKTGVFFTFKTAQFCFLRRFNIGCNKWLSMQSLSFSTVGDIETNSVYDSSSPPPCFKEEFLYFRDVSACLTAPLVVETLLVLRFLRVNDRQFFLCHFLLWTSSWETDQTHFTAHGNNSVFLRDTISRIFNKNDSNNDS